MPEVQRMNNLVECPGCKTQVNPYVIETVTHPLGSFIDPPPKALKVEGALSFDKQVQTVKYECPTCDYRWHVAKNVT